MLSQSKPLETGVSAAATQSRSPLQLVRAPCQRFQPGHGEGNRLARHQPHNAILVVDDEGTVRNLLARVLRLKGFEVVTATNGDDALEKARHRTFDGFLIDLYMPGLGGLDLCRALRAEAAYRRTPVLCMTAADETEHVNAAFAAGADDFVTKPVNLTVLDARLRGQLERYRSLQEMEELRSNLNRYVSRRTQQMVKAYTRTGILPPPQEEELCILFSDVRGYTQLSQEVEPRALFAELSASLGMQVDSVYQNGGDVDKFAGDGIMAVFDGADGAVNACRCALDILRRTAASNGAQGEPMLRLGIGIHCGRALVGNVGSERQLDYSVIGETVNLAARLCGAAAPITAVASAAVVAACSNAADLGFEPPRAVTLKGVRDPVAAYALATGTSAA